MGLYSHITATEWSTLIGQDPSRYCALIGGDHDASSPAPMNLASYLMVLRVASMQGKDLL